MYVYGEVPSFVQEFFNSYRGFIKINNSVYSSTPWDTDGIDYFIENYLFSISNTDIIMLCFSIVDKLSFDNIKTKWYPAIKKASQKPEIRLIGTKSDLKKSISPAQCIDKDEAVNLAKEINAFDYVECSSFLNDGVMQVFDFAKYK